MVGGRCGRFSACLSRHGDAEVKPSSEGPGSGRHLAAPDLKSHSILGQGVSKCVSSSVTGVKKGSLLRLESKSSGCKGGDLPHLPHLDQAKCSFMVTPWGNSLLGWRVRGKAVSGAACLQPAHLSLPFQAHSNLSKMQSLSYREQSLLRR